MIIGGICAARGMMVYRGKFVPPGAKWYIGGICAARGMMVIWGNLCRQGHDSL